MRTIKFRGKRIDYNWFVYGHYYYSLDDEAHVITDIIHYKDFVCNNMSEPAHDEQVNYHVRPDTVGQFTGLHDKNGKEIYEGDILSFDGKYGYVVLFEQGSFICYNLTLKDIFGEKVRWGLLFRAYELYINIEVIGNIHDNPELLGENNDNK